MATWLFSDRMRWAKVCLLLLAAVALWVSLLSGPADGPGSIYVAIARGEIPPEKVDRPVGPEDLTVIAVEPERIIAEKFRTRIVLELPSPDTPERQELRRRAGDLQPGSHVSAVSRHIAGERFLAGRILLNPYRKTKFAVSGLAAVLLAGLFPVLFRWSRGAFRLRADGPPRGAESTHA